MLWETTSLSVINPQTQPHTRAIETTDSICYSNMQAGTDNLVNGIGFYMNTHTLHSRQSHNRPTVPGTLIKAKFDISPE